MKIGLVLSSPPGYSETFFNSKIKGLQAHGHEVVVLTQSENKDFKLCPVIKGPSVVKSKVLQSLKMCFVFIGLLPHLSHVIKFIKLERKEKVSINRLVKNIYLCSHILSQQIHWLHFGFSTQAIGSENLAEAIGAKMAVSFRGFDINVYPEKYPNCYDLVWKRVNKVHSISNYLLQKAYDLGLDKSIPYEIIYPAVDNNLMPSGEVKKGVVLQIVTIARLNWIKGVDFAIDAMQYLKSIGVNFEYHIIGSGLPTEYERYNFQISQLGLDKHVKLLGRLSHQETLLKLSKCDIYLQPSIQEGFCNSVLEAQAIGCLCIVSNGDGIKENIIDNKTGWIVPKREPKLLAEKIKTVYQLSENKKNEIKKQAVNRVKTKFTIDKQQGAFYKFYN